MITRNKASLASVVICLILPGCSGKDKRVNENIEDGLVIPKISEAEPSKLTGTYPEYRDNRMSFYSDESWDLEKIVSSISYGPIEDTLSDESVYSSKMDDKTVLAKGSQPKVFSTIDDRDSLREILKGRIEAINQHLQIQPPSNSSSSNESDFPTVFFRCSVLRGGKFKSGDKITLRALENASIGETAIRKHDLIEGYCLLDDRIQIEVHRINGKAIKLYGFDLDGMKGLWFYDSSSETISSLSDEIIKDGSSLISSRVGRIARGITSVGADAVARKRHSLPVEIPSGYELFLGTN